MTSLLLLALVLQQGPRNLQVGPDQKIEPPLVVPAGTAIPVKLLERISTADAEAGDPVVVETIFPITVNDKIAIPVGSRILGRLADARRPGRISGKAELTIAFHWLVLPSGIRTELFGILGGFGGPGERKGETSIEGESSVGSDVGTVAGTAGRGAAIGVIAGRSAGSAGAGAAIGAAAGIAGVLLTRGKDLVLEPGTTLEVVLDRPLER